MEIICRAPQTEEEWKTYYSIRYLVLRKPWGQPIGSERDDCEQDAVHAGVWVRDQLVGVGRAHIVDDKGFIRFMAVLPAFQALGLGGHLVTYLESKVKQKGVQLIELQARENALNFYIKLGYESIERTHLLYGTIQHYLMRKFI